MAPPFKCAKPTPVAQTDFGAPNSSGVSPVLFIPFQTAPGLERIPDDVLHEILSHLPTLSNQNMLRGRRRHPPIIPADSLVRTPTLRALSRTSRLLRSRCLPMAWQRIELCSARLPKHNTTWYSVIGDATQACVRVLNACPHLLPLVQTVVVCLTRYNSAVIVPALADCLALLPNVASIQVLHVNSRMTTAIKNGFEGKRLPTVRTISLPSTAHEIVKCCPNLEEVTCTDGSGSTIVGSLLKGNCDRVRVLKGITAPLTRELHLLSTFAERGYDLVTGLAKLLPDLEHTSAGALFENRVFTTDLSLIEHVYSENKAVTSKVLESKLRVGRSDCEAIKA